MDLNKVSFYLVVVFDCIKIVVKNVIVIVVLVIVNVVGVVGLLIGNFLIKDFDVGKYVVSFGLNLVWKIYEGKKKIIG